MILVTGGSGLLGKTVIQKLLDSGETIRSLERNTSIGIHHPNLQIFKSDVLDVIGLEEAMTGISKVYHVAGLVSFLPSDEANMIKVNVEGTANVVNAAIKAGVEKLLHVSSVAALGRIRNEIVNESAQWTEEANNSNYGRTKYYGELEVWRGIAEGLNAVIVNPSIILGPADWNTGSTRMFKHAYEEFPWYTNGTTGVVDVRDVADIMISLMNGPVQSEKFIVSGHNVSYKELFTSMAVAFNKKPPHKAVTPFLAKIVTQVEKLKSFISGKPPLLTPETANTALAKIEYDSKKLLEYLPGFQYRTLEDTIAFTAMALKQKINNS